MYQSTMAEQTAQPAPAQSQLNGQTIVRQPDGTITIKTGQQGPRIPQQGDFDENLAEQMEPSARRTLGAKLVEYAETDRQSRKDWVTREERALQMMGIVDIPAKDAKTPGHTLTHPMLMEVAVRFQANAVMELFPPDGPAKTKILGRQTADRVAQADRIETFLNYYLTEIDRGYFADSDQMLLYLPMSGSAFRKAGQNWSTGLPELRYTKATNFIAPYSGTDLKSMPRYAHAYTMTGLDMEAAMDNEMFVASSLVATPEGEAKHSPTADKADLREAVIHIDDRLYGMLEYHIDLPINIDAMGRNNNPRSRWRKQLVLPYVVVLEEKNQEVLLVRRNWKQADERRRKRIWFAHHKYLPGLGFYGFGLPHVIGSLGNAASGAVNALLDGALASNFQGGFKTKEGRSAKIGGDVRLEHGVWKDVDASYEDLAKSFYTPPFKEPSPALFHLLTGLVDAGQRFAGTTDAAVGDGNNTGPVGTTLALIEQASKPQSAIHKRLHKSMSDELGMLGEMIEDFMPSRYDYDLGDESQFLLKADFDGRVDVIPVTDPNITSDTQRIMRAQSVIQLQQEAPDLYTPDKRVAAHRRLIKALKIPEADEISPQVENPLYLDPVSENGLMMVGKGIRAYPTQDHDAHILIHQDGLERASSVLAAHQDENALQITAAFQAHMREHYAMKYRALVFQQAGVNQPLDQNGMPQTLDPQTERQITAKVQQALPAIPKPPPPPQAADPVQAKIDAQNKLAEAEIARRDTAAQAEQRRKDADAAAKKTREDAAAAAAEARKDTATGTAIIRDATRAHVMTAAELRAKRELARAAAAAKAKNGGASKR